MAVPKLPIDYVTKDYEGLFQMMKDAIPLLAPEWTNTADTDQGIVILQNLAYGLHVLGYYEDKGVIEGFLSTARTRKAVLMLSRFLGYEPYKQEAAVVTLEFTKTTSSVSQDISIPAGTQVSTDPKLGTVIVFETNDSILIPAGETSGSVDATQGITISDEILGVSTGAALQTFTLNYPDVLQDTLVMLTEENGTTYSWTRVDSFIDSAGDDRHYIASVDDDGIMTVTFGDGLTGMKIPVGAPVTTTYRSGGGKSGNVGANKLVEIVNTNLSGLDSVTNPLSATGGDDAESIDSIRIRAPKYFRTRSRAVTPNDFEDLAALQPGVHTARCVETFNATSDVNLYIATKDGSAPTTALKNAVKSSIEDVMIMNQNLYVFDASYKDFTIDVTLTIRTGSSNTEVKSVVETALSTNYSATAFDFGDSVFRSQLINFIFQSDSRILNVSVNDPTDDVTTLETEIPRMTAYAVAVTGGV